MAKVLIESGEVGVEGVMFHLQQCAEKCIKALLSFHNVHFEKIHDIERLIEMCEENGISVPDYVNEFIVLSNFAVESRYGFAGGYEGDVKDYIELLEKFVTHIGAKTQR